MSNTYIPSNKGTQSNIKNKSFSVGRAKDITSTVIDLVEKVDESTKKLERMDTIVYLGFMVLIVMVATMVVDAYEFKSSTEQQILDKIQTMSEQNDKATIAAQAQQIKDLETQLQTR